ncbi:MAG: hypothetical protein ABR519_01680, partial [Bacteroidales bacterium]
MNRLIIPSLLLILLAAQGTDLSAQCLAGISVDPPNGSQNLTIQFTGEGIIPGTEYPCDDPLLPAGWSSTPFTIGSPCLVPDGSAPDGSDYLWVGARDATGKRWVETSDYDMSGGGTIFFEIRYGTDVSTDCPGPNRTDQGVSLEYSINGGADWSKITYYTPYSTDTTFTDWNSFEY